MARHKSARVSKVAWEMYARCRLASRGLNNQPNQKGPYPIPAQGPPHARNCNTPRHKPSIAASTAWHATHIAKMAIWMDEPTATPSARSILFFIATMTAVMCSHALPAIGSTMIPRKAWLRPVWALNSSILLQRYLHSRKVTHMVVVRACGQRVSMESKHLQQLHDVWHGP